MSLSTLSPASSHHQISIPTATATVRVIDVSECIPDITANLISASPEHYDLPPDIFEDLVFQALNDLVDDFAQDPDQYLKPHHETAIDQIANEYVNSEF